MIPGVSQVTHLDGPALFSVGVDVDTLTQEKQLIIIFSLIACRWDSLEKL